MNMQTILMLLIFPTNYIPSPPPGSAIRITENNIVRITEDGQIRITE